MSGLNPDFFVKTRNPKQARTPWVLDCGRSLCGRLVYYISGGGMRTFGRTDSQDNARRHHRRFLIAASVLGVVYLAFYCL